MRKRFWVAMLAISFIASSYIFTNAAASSSAVMISQVQLGNTSSASNELIELYNTSASDVEITNWCLYYASASSVTMGSRLGCFSPESNLIHLYLPAHSYALAISTVMSTNNPSLGSDLKFSATLSGTAGHIRLVDATQSEIDKIGWGTTALAPELAPATAAPNGKVMQRKMVTFGQLQDTDNNADDFELASPRVAYITGSVYEVQDVCSNIDGIQQEIPTGYTAGSDVTCLPPPIDACSNIDDLQIAIPVGYAYDQAGLCQIDVCSNIEELQLVVPEGKEANGSGECSDIDVCINLEGAQTTIPNGYRSETGICMVEFLPVIITELLPNAKGDDIGHEFVELYNPNDTPVDLAVMRLVVGISSVKVYAFPSGAVIPSHGYYIFVNDEVHFTLVNTRGGVALETVDGQEVSALVSYDAADEGYSWALINTVWQYTNQPTPGSDNVPSTLDDDIEEVVTELKPCAPNQYRNAETNRCRLLVTVGSTLTPCKTGQYRSEETNRCRSIASEVTELTPCNANQERNPETNRCRVIARSETTLSPCKENQERNPETNRCRTVVSQVPTAAFAVEPIADTTEAFIGWWALGGVGIIALAYGGWEWRREIIRASRRVTSFFHFKK